MNKLSKEVFESGLQNPLRMIYKSVIEDLMGRIIGKFQVIRNALVLAKMLKIDNPLSRDVMPTSAKEIRDRIGEIDITDEKQNERFFAAMEDITNQVVLDAHFHCGLLLGIYVPDSAFTIDPWENEKKVMCMCGQCPTPVAHEDRTGIDRGFDLMQDVGAFLAVFATDDAGRLRAQKTLEEKSQQKDVDLLYRNLNDLRKYQGKEVGQA